MLISRFLPSCFSFCPLACLFGRRSARSPVCPLPACVPSLLLPPAGRVSEERDLAGYEGQGQRGSRIPLLVPSLATPDSVFLARISHVCEQTHCARPLRTTLTETVTRTRPSKEKIRHENRKNTEKVQTLDFETRR